MKTIINDGSSTADDPALPVDIPDIEAKIAELAYYKAEARGFEPGHEMEDWLEAEQELTQSLLNREVSRVPR